MSLVWIPSEQKHMSVPGDGVSSEVLHVLQDTFGGGSASPEYRVTLTSNHAFALRAMALASGGLTKYTELANLVEEHGEIEVWGEM